MYSAEMMCIHDYKRVDKRVARRLYNEGQNIYLVPCKCNVHSMFTLRTADYMEKAYSFDTVVNEFEWYNCDSERGNYTMFFIKNPA